MITEWHSKNAEEAIGILKTSLTGLSSKEAEERLRKYGLNKLAEEKPPSRFRIFVRQFKSAFVYILSAAFLISLFLKEYTDAGVIFAAIFLNTVIGFIQENRANQALAALKKLVEYKARVIRDGHESIIDAQELVSGDIIILESGDKIPADVRFLEIYDFETNEAALTGESTPVKKIIEPLPPETILAERKNMAFMGTIVVRGRARAIVVATGTRTAMGEVAKLVLETRKESTPLEIQIKKLAFFLTIIIIIASILLFSLGLLTGKSFYEMFLTAIAAAVASVPEGLLIATTIILAIGMQRLAKEKAIVRHLLAAETLGSVSTICVDKTGTITEGEMRVAHIWTGWELVKKEALAAELGNGKTSLIKTLELALLCNNAVIENPEAPLEQWRVLADPTQKALFLAGIEAGLKIDELRKQQTRFDEIPFESIRKYAVTAHHLDKQNDILYFRGAPERLLEKAGFIDANGKIEELDASQRNKILAKIDQFASQGFRVVAVGYKPIPCNHRILDDEESVLKDLIFLSIFLLRDPLRPNTKETVALTKEAGIKTIMITGDHRSTAQAIAKELGLVTNQKNILTGEELEALSDEQYKKIASRINIYARVSPAHKSRIVDALQKNGEIVAMTGDGVNDAPALKSADIGIAVGGGTDVAKETADIVLLDNNFKTIVKAVEGGRVIFDNIRKTVVYLLSDNFHELAIIVLSLIAQLPLPILPAQILWVNLAEDSLPAMALAFEPKEADVLRQSPRPKASSILGRQHKFLVFSIASMTTLLLFGLFSLLLHFSHDLVYSRTIIFVGLSLSSLLYIHSCRSLRQNIWHVNPFTNGFLNFSILFGVGLIVLAVYLPPLQKILDTVPLGLKEWLLLFGVAVLNVFLVELLKKVFILRNYKKLIDAE